MDPVAVQAMMTAMHTALWHAHLGEAAAALPAESARAVGALCSAVWEGALLAACVAVGLKLMPRLSAAARSVVWLNVFALVAALHFVPLMERGTAVAGGAAARAVIHPALFHLDPRWSLAIAGLWAALTAWKLAELAMSAVSLQRVARRATVVDAGEVLRDLLSGAGEDGRRGRAAELCTSDEVERPCVIGFFRPRVLIPEALLGELNEVELGQVLLHEMEHVRRWDDWRNLVQKIGVALFPLNPALVWVEHRLCTERELACDDRVMRASTERKTYALCLARVAEFSLVNRGLALALGAWGRRPELVKRVQRILRRPAEVHTGRKALLAPAALTLAALGCAAALARCPQVVSFAPRMHEAAGRLVSEPARQQADEAASVQTKPAMATDALATRAVMVKAVLPHRRMAARTALARVKRTAPETELVRTTARMQRMERVPEWVVMTEWERMEMPQLVITVQGTRSYRSTDKSAATDMRTPDRPTDKDPSVGSAVYAAVPFANGWLIVQI